MRTPRIVAIGFALLLGPPGGFVGGGALLGDEGAVEPSLAGASTLNGLVAYWPFDEGQGDTAANLMGLNGDLFGEGAVGVAKVAGAAWAEGKHGGALRFGSKGPGVTVEPTDTLDCENEVSVAAWIKVDEPGGEGMIWNCERGYRLATLAGGSRLRFMLCLDGKWAAGEWLASKGTIARGSWHHVAGVYDGKERRIYIDGELDSKDAITATIARGGAASIGKDFVGLIDELKIWNRVLSQAEIQQAMREGQAQVKAALRPEHGLRFYPVRCVAMQGKVEPVEIALFNSGREPVRGDATLTVVAPSGSRLAEETLALSIPARGQAQAGLTFRPEQFGRHTLIVRFRDQELFRAPLYVLAPRRKPAVGELKLKQVASLDLTRPLGPEVLCDDGGSRVVDSPLGRYRETSPERFSRFVVRATLRRTGLHLVRITYPDDKMRTCELTVSSTAPGDFYNAQTGYCTGGTYPLSGRFQTLDCLVWARSAEQWVRFCAWAQDCPVAASRVEVFEVEGGLPASAASAERSLRQIGLYWEDAYPLPFCFGGGAGSFEDFDRVASNLCDYMDYSGQNVLFHPAVWYNGPLYNSLLEPRGRGQGANGGGGCPRNAWLDILLKRFEERGLQFNATMNVHTLPSLLASANTDIERIKAGEPTFNTVTRDNQVLGETWHHLPPAFNAIHPRVAHRVLAIVEELATRYGNSPAFAGVTFHLTNCQLLQLGGLESSYDDWTIAEFEKDEGVKPPVDARDPERFRKRYDWLMAHAREQWIAWRCRRIADHYGEAARILRSRNPDLQLVLSVWTPAIIRPLPRQRWEQGERLVQLTRETGVDPAMLGRHPGVVIQKFMGPMDYRWRLSLAGLKEEQALLPLRAADFDEGQLKDYRTTDRFGVHFHDRYFESQSRDAKGPLGGGWQPLKSEWYREPGWLASMVVPGHEHFMEYYAHAMAALDPSLITNGGWTVGTVGHERQVERFASVFRLLPPGNWQRIPDLDGQVVGRTLDGDGTRYLYLVNRSAMPVPVKLGATVVGDPLEPLGASPALQRTEQGAEVTLGAYQLAAWRSGD